MKILGISGSPVKGGNNEKVMDYVLNKAKEKGFDVEKISAGDVKGCIACGTCKKVPGTCSIKDAMEIIRPKLAQADALIISTPVYFGTLSSQLKAIFDRTLPLRRDGFRLKDKIGAAIAIGRSRNGGQEYAIQAIHAFMHIHGMVVVGDNNHFGGTIAAPFEEDKIGLKTVDDTVEKVCSMLSRIKKES
jgi:multimeric flavodoxin WrbA